jgi:CYTH domain-containing protein
MAQNQLGSIIKHATELKQKMGEEEKQIPAWIQDHITNSENYISQAASNYHEYGDSNESVVTEASDMDLVKNMEKTIKDLMARLNVTKDSKQREAIKKGIAVNMGILNFWKGRMVGDKIREVNEASPCWKGYKQVGMKNKNGKEVPNCVPESVMSEARSVGAIQKDFTKVIAAIASELEKYKSVKGTPKAKQYVVNLKKLNAAKEKLESEMDYVVSNIYADAELEEGCGCK